MNDEKEPIITEENESHENDDMITQNAVKGDETLSFKPSEEARPQHTWTKKQKRAVWIAAVVAVVIFLAISFLLSLAGIDVFSLLGGNPAMQ
ncbi:MAG: hypothetical protein J6L61_02950 [Ruminiclostridium sp.]|nr:hypothetical protein [Ruminiclostridium sp.]